MDDSNHGRGSAVSYIDFQTRDTLTPKHTQELSDGRLDLAIVALPVGEKIFEEVPLFSEGFDFDTAKDG